MIGVVLVVVGSVALVAANVAWWWLRDRSQTARIGNLTQGLASAMGRVHDLSGQVSSLEAENRSLRDDNRALKSLLGADAERAALSGSCADEAGWYR